MEYQQITIFTADEEQREVLIALLDGAGFEAFEEREDVLLAFVPADRYDENTVAEISGQLGLRYEAQAIAQQNWNARWEQDFQPVVVPGFCTVRASFHRLPVTTPYEIIITPKMSFGTGHHATTQLMMESLRDRQLTGQQVLDFGTGTGILAILAVKLGAALVLAIDIDEWSVENAGENVALNGTAGIEVRQGSLEAAAGNRYDLILANINRHILLQYIAEMSRLLQPGGQLVLSGILTEDEPVITESAGQAGLQLTYRRELNNWLSLSFDPIDGR